MSEARHYSNQLGSLTDRQLQAALERFGLGRLLSAEAIAAGNFGQNLFVTSTGGEYVLRGAPHYDWQFPAERFFARLLHERTSVPVPWPYLLDHDEDIFGWSYVLMPRMPGLQLSDGQVRGALSLNDKLGIARAMGETLVQLQALTWPTCGEYALAADDIVPLSTSFGERVIERIHDNLEMAIPLSDCTTEADIAWVEKLIAVNRWALEVPLTPCFVMEDFKEGNVVASRVGDAWQITGLFDLMGAYMGDGEVDLPRQLADYVDEDPALAQAFAASYLAAREAAGRPMRPGFPERFEVYMLLDRLILWQFGQRIGPWWDPQLALRQWAEPYTSLRMW